MSIPATAAVFTAHSVILDATRYRQLALDQDKLAMPALFAILEVRRLGILAPVLDSLIALFESCSGRTFQAGRLGDARVSNDERGLLDLLQTPEGSQVIFRRGATRVRLSLAMKVAIRSTRLMIRLALGRAALDGHQLNFIGTTRI